ncbi:beta strand repeat-containing protein [Acetobacterium tundrae]|uniref:Carbohydrate-binding domain-containing protein n=1 Tax=Acetobacterium tundrae TaxID=132932 RepID=A0ABR6WLK7_9FIRM|nr:hypothetical protein [Acetobacterium tundrae]MBC3797324.1 hypothetical protein [Acetobacterium tundrae]
MNKKRFLLVTLLIMALSSLSLSACTTASSGTVIYGKVTAINGSDLTIAVGTLNEGSGDSQTTTQPANATDNSTTTQPANATDNSTTTQPATATDSSTTTPPTPPTTTGTDAQTPPSGTAPSGTAPSGTAPSGTAQGSMPELLTLTGETRTITLSDAVSITKQSASQPGSGANSTSTDSASGTAASVSDITTGTVLKITYKSNSQKIASLEIITGGGQTGGSAAADTGTSAYNLTASETLTGGTYTSTNADENAIRAENGITAALNNVTVSKTAGAASNNDASSFYGLNAAVLALSDAILNITGGNITATADGSNGVFAYDGGTININDTTINVSGGNSGGIEVAGGGILNATNLTVKSTVKAAIRSDRGGGTMVVDGGTYSTSGSSGAPAVYSTADITVSNAALTANTSEAIVVEGFNSVALNNCTVAGNMSGTYGSSGENIHNVMLYQSMSGDAATGNSTFTMNGGSLTANNGDMFYVTNTTANIQLSGVTLTPAANTYLLLVAGNDASNGWGTAGSNGGNCTFTAAQQALAGDIKADAISTLDLTIKDASAFTGAINSDGTAAAALKVTLDATSTWSLTADSYVTAFNGSMSNVQLNGHSLYVNGEKAS